MSKETVKQIADKLGDEAIAKACGVSDHSVRNARWQGRFPASWFPVIREMCSGAKIKCPESAFNFKSPSSVLTTTDSLPSKKVGDAATDIQGDAA